MFGSQASNGTPAPCKSAKTACVRVASGCWTPSEIGSLTRSAFEMDAEGTGFTTCALQYFSDAEWDSKMVLMPPKIATQERFCCSFFLSHRCLPQCRLARVDLQTLTGVFNQITYNCRAFRSRFDISLGHLRARLNSKRSRELWRPRSVARPCWDQVPAWCLSQSPE